MTRKRFETSQGTVEAHVHELRGTTRVWHLTIDGVHVGTIERAGSSEHLRTTCPHAPAEYRTTDYLGTFQRAAIETALADLSWLGGIDVLRRIAAEREARDLAEPIALADADEPVADGHQHTLDGGTTWVACADLAHCPSLCDCPADACTAAPVVDVPPPFTAATVVDAVAAHGVTVALRHTGGGVFTIFAGPVWTDRDGEQRATAVAGPFSIDGPDFVGVVDDFLVGPDTPDDDLIPVHTVADLGARNATDVAHLIVLQVLGAGRDAAMSADLLDAAGFDGTARGLARRRVTVDPATTSATREDG